MTSRYDRARSGIDALLGSDASERIVRVDVGDDGVLVATVATDAGPRWFRATDGGVEELSPLDEQRVPAGAALARACAEGRAELLSWRPGRRMVVLVTARDGAHVLKAHRRGRAAAAAARAASLRSALAPALRLPRVLRADAAGETVAMEVLAGEAPRADDLGTFQSLGRALEHAASAAPIEGLARHDRSAELAELDRIAARHVLARGSLPSGWSAVRAVLDAARGAPPRALVLAHRDLHEGQILVRAGSVGVLDWDFACLAEPELDDANLGVHLLLAGWLGTRGVRIEGAGAAVAALSAARTDLFEPARRFYRATTALRLALVHGLRPSSRAGVEPLMSLADACAREAACA